MAAFRLFRVSMPATTMRRLGAASGRLVEAARKAVTKHDREVQHGYGCQSGCVCVDARDRLA